MKQNDNKVNKSLERYNEFIIENGISSDLSKLWESYKNDFSPNFNEKQGNLRSYNTNKIIKDSKILLILNIYFYSNRIKYIFGVLLQYLQRIIFKLLLLPKKFENKYSFYNLSLIYKPLIRDVNFLKFYKKMFNILEWNLSYNTFKNCYYYYKFSNSNNNFQYKSVIEIGSGLAQFAMFNLINSENLIYICVDIEEMIPSAYLSIIDNYPNNDVDLFLPHEVNEFNLSNSKKKVLFLTPKQYYQLENLINFKIDLLVNIESFAEMKISVVNDYLNKSKDFLNTDSMIFSCNRLSRLIDRTDRIQPDITKYTLFSDYNLINYNVILYEIDQLRSHIQGAEIQENIIYLGRLKNN